MEVILLEGVEKLGEPGDIVKVADGFGRNYLLPRRIALRATKTNMEIFEKQREEIIKRNIAKREEAALVAQKLEGVSVVLVRQAAEDGKLYGSVSGRDIAKGLLDVAGVELEASQIVLTDRFKEIGMYDVAVALHPEVKVKVGLQISRIDQDSVHS
ncbi:50S ribosomal protein L9 [Rickettsiales endosymbiont of Peranema trichophorum]|uniref:50S ribosomal protein L9 n=1 Tax=Rickettsiales endosymbiont of Peranema trichophorum TaxID=2486577 RepID=UPI001023937E|nr:50S ribosomal protein L9 [Rickettsiales endosymbiont of Peranema trichophorum]RZI47747.1 50S ribosomal protein L9 [Rickettsiales endosymbiont of Peranema trichophorum]